MNKIIKASAAAMLAFALVGCSSSTTSTTSAASSAASSAAGYTDGTYEGVGTGKAGDVKVSVTVEGGVITAVEVTEQNETAGVADAALSDVPAAIVEANGTEGVDTISGCTLTSQAIIDAVNAALADAQ